MIKLFLSSFFSDVAGSFETFAQESLQGKVITFIPTASVTEKVTFYVESGRKALKKMGLIIDEVDISKEDPDKAKATLQRNPYIYISGGNVFFLLQELKRTGIDAILLEEIQKGKCYIGESAGSVILSPDIEYAQHMDNPKDAPNLSNYESIGAVDFYTVPHYGNFPFKKAAQKIMDLYGGSLALRPINNSQYIEVIGKEIQIREGAKLKK